MANQGRRLPDVLFGDLPERPELGDYWKYVADDGEPITLAHPGKLTEHVWGFRPPVSGLGIGTLTLHTVREHEDGTISVRRNDGSSNSIKITGGGRSWHGYIEHGVWEEA